MGPGLRRDDVACVETPVLKPLRLTHNSFTLSMLQRMSGTSDPEPLEVLASIVQPPQGYEREQLHEYSSASALNHLVDAVPPESETARKFNEIAALIASGAVLPAQTTNCNAG